MSLLHPGEIKILETKPLRPTRMNRSRLWQSTGWPPTSTGAAPTGLISTWPPAVTATPPRCCRDRWRWRRLVFNSLVTASPDFIAVSYFWQKASCIENISFSGRCFLLILVNLVQVFVLSGHHIHCTAPPLRTTLLHSRGRREEPDGGGLRLDGRS